MLRLWESLRLSSHCPPCETDLKTLKKRGARERRDSLQAEEGWRRPECRGCGLSVLVRLSSSPLVVAAWPPACWLPVGARSSVCRQRAVVVIFVSYKKR